MAVATIALLWNFAFWSRQRPEQAQTMTRQLSVIMSSPVGFVKTTAASCSIGTCVFKWHILQQRHILECQGDH